MMGSTSRISKQEHQDTQSFNEEDQNCLHDIQSALPKLLPYPWVAVVEKAGIHVLLLSRTEEKAVQRRVYFSPCGAEKITVHCKPIPAILSETILNHDPCDSLVPITENGVSILLKRIITVVQRLQAYEVCVGIDNIQFKPLWNLDKYGKIDDNPFHELRYKQTFRPFGCQLLVSTSGYLKRHCSFCTQIKARFRAKLGRLQGDIFGPTTPNLYLSREQLLQKVQTQEKKLKSNRAQIAKLKANLQQASLKKGFSADDKLSKELLRICMNYVEMCE